MREPDTETKDGGGTDARRRDVVYLIPHQDDELYTWGIDIVSRVRRGWHVEVVLVCDGAGCSARLDLGDGGSCPEIDDHHAYALTRGECQEARDAEFVDSCLSLGIAREDIHFARHRVPDLEVTVEDGVEVIEEVLGRHPDALLCAHAPRHEVPMAYGSRDLSMPPNRDHCMLGRALEIMHAKGRVRHVEYCVEFYDLERFRAENPGMAIDERPMDPSMRDALEGSLASYKRWDPEAGRYALGWHSSKELHEGALDNAANYILVP